MRHLQWSVAMHDAPIAVLIKCMATELTAARASTGEVAVLHRSPNVDQRFAKHGTDVCVLLDMDGVRPLFDVAVQQLRTEPRWFQVSQSTLLNLATLVSPAGKAFCA